MSLVFLLCITLFSSPSGATNLCLPYSEFSRQFWGTKFLDGYEAFDFSKNPMTTGVEVEFVVPRKILYRKTGELIGREEKVRRILIDIIREKVQEEFPDIKTSIYLDFSNGYVLEYTINNREYRYRIKPEPTRRNSLMDVRVELATPPLYNQQDINLFYDILNQLQIEGEIQISSHSGVHVHIGFPEAQFQEVALALSLFSAFEKQIYEAFSVLPERQRRYAKFIREERFLNFLRKLYSDEAPDRSNDQIYGMEMLRLLMIIGERKYYGLNVLPVETYGTLEFRLFNSSFNSEEIGQMIDFAQSFVRAIREKDPQLLRLLENRNLETLPFERLAEAIGLEIPTSSPATRKRRVSATR